MFTFPRALRRSAAAALSAALLLGAAACGDSSSGGDTPGPVDDAYTAQAAELIKVGTGGLLYFEGAEADITLDKIKVYEDWSGPTQSAKPVAGAKVDIIVCKIGTSCEEVGRKAAAIAQQIGWTAEVIDGQGTPEGFQKALATAATHKPSAVITVAIPENQAADGIAELQKAKIPVVGISAVKEGGTVGFDANVSSRETFQSVLQVTQAIADSKGTAKAVFLWDVGYPHLVEALNTSKKVFAACTGCQLLEVRERTLAQAGDPIEMQNIATSLIQKYGDDLQYIFTPYGNGVESIIAALKAAGRTDVKVLSKNAEPERLSSVAAGDQFADFGAVRGWNAYAAIDQVVRLLAGKPALPDAEQGIPATIFRQSNAPEDGKVDWDSYVDFAERYTRMWSAAQ
ncbi:substrate-binding domain-containing protein [Micromonospora sp. WMMD1128]|uniref:substrate-binding domain-containing protein n=1 Tax=unclassified Micromonospora TaxID=2617518 RepID=UPI00248AE437|nr:MULTISPECIES: substrate-binding domain-containing protein [unclassified Micromonospora]WBB75940.1 substrate-binding domain-containing protein [Micromonospora sp. WMMD1128]WFE36274.1 substrate-binding domain-containing protein [Micromonospora sp. WMMD975]